MKTDIRRERARFARRALPVVLALCAAGGLLASSAEPPGIRGLQRGTDGRMTIRIVPSGATNEFIDVFATESLSAPNWRVMSSYLRANGQKEIFWSEPAAEAPEERPRSRFFRIGRADLDLNENGIPDAREALLPIFDLPQQSRARWARAGMSAVPATTTTLNVKTYGATGNGTTDDTTAIKNAISKAAAGNVVYLPAGTYRITKTLYLKSNMILRGDGAALTSLIFEGSGTVSRCIGITHWDGDQTTTYVTVTDGMAFGSTEVTVSSASGFAAGDIVEIEEDNDPAWGLSSTWQQRLPGQINRVTAVDAAKGRLTLARQLRHTFTAVRHPRLRKLVMYANTGIENLFIRRKDAIEGFTIEMKFAVNCWVRNVESYMTYKAHVWMDRSYECDVRQNYFHDSFVFGGDGQGYGVCSGKHTSDCLIENNVFYHLRHSMIVGIGANGNVYGYNFSSERALDPVHGTLQPDISVHGNYVFLNLFEGNVLEDADLPDYYEPAGPGNTLFRNRISNSGTAIDVGSDGQNLLGNVLTQGTISTESTVKSIVDYGNVKCATTKNVVWPETTAGALPDSFYRSVPPDFILNASGVSWPPIGPDVPLNAVTPAQQRYVSGMYIP